MRHNCHDDRFCDAVLLDDCRHWIGQLLDLHDDEDGSLENIHDRGCRFEHVQDPRDGLYYPEWECTPDCKESRGRRLLRRLEKRIRELKKEQA